MAGKNIGLGKGLNALFGETAEEYEIALEHGKDVSSIEIPLDKIIRDQNQPRKSFDQIALEELKNSILTHGVINPIVVNKIGDKYQIVAGERRYRASKLANLSKIPAVIMDLNEKKVREIALIENLQREDLNPIEASRAIKELMDKYGLTQEGVAERISKPRSVIANLLRILTLPEVVISMIESERLTLGHAKVLAGLEKDSDKIKFATFACDGKMSVRELEKRVQLANQPKKEKKTQTLSLELTDFEQKLVDTFATKVKVNGNEEKGKIVIEYYTKDDLERIYNQIDNIKK